MDPTPLSYAPPRRSRRPTRWYHWFPLAVLMLLLAGFAAVTWWHWHDPQFWGV